jgi:hypothetical protein
MTPFLNPIRAIVAEAVPHRKVPHVADTNHQRPSVMQDDGPKEEPLYWPSVAVDSRAAAASGHASTIPSRRHRSSQLPSVGGPLVMITPGRFTGPRYALDCPALRAILSV